MITMAEREININQELAGAAMRSLDLIYKGNPGPGQRIGGLASLMPDGVDVHGFKDFLEDAIQPREPWRELLIKHGVATRSEAYNPALTYDGVCRITDEVSAIWKEREKLEEVKPQKVKRGKQGCR